LVREEETMDVAQPRPVGDADPSARAEGRLRDEVAACTLMLNDLGILGYSGHVSARLPGGETFLIQSVDQSRAELTPDKLLVCDMDGRKIAGPEGLKPPSEVHLHSEIFKARPDVNSVAHFHHDRTTVFTLAEGAKLTPVKNHAIRWASGIPVHEDPSHLNSPARGRAMVAALAQHNAVMIRAHGQIIVAESVPAVLIDAVHFVENAQACYDASLLGKVRPLTGQEIELFGHDLKRDKHIPKLWTYYVGRGRAKGLLPTDWAI
jgi:L-ribulose-5-phosphate 4-epimerase